MPDSDRTSVSMTSTPTETDFSAGLPPRTLPNESEAVIDAMFPAS